MNSILRLEQVSLQASVGSSFLLQDISLSIQPATKVALVGASGAGKTSLLRLLNRLIVPQQGQIYLEDVAIEQIPATALRRQVALSPQEPKLLGMKVSDALSYPLRLMKLSESEIRQRQDTWTNLLRIPSSWLNKTELQLSLGQRQLVAIARTLMMQPRVLLLDEPTSALDLGTASHLLQVLDELNQNQLTLVIVNHQLDLISGFCDRLLYLNAGKLELDLPSTQDNWQTVEQEILRAQVEQEQEWN